MSWSKVWTQSKSSMANRRPSTVERPLYSIDQASVSADDLPLPNSEQLLTRVLERFEAPDYEPPRLPRAAIRLMALVRQPKVRFKEIVAALEQDQLLTAKVLRVAQSSLNLPSGGHVRTIRDALVRLGLKGVRNLAMQASLHMRIFRSEGYADAMQRLSRHHLATAHAAQLVAGLVGVDRSEAFLCGLMHDIGMALTFLALVDVVPNSPGPPELDGLWSRIHDVHGEISERVLTNWGMSEELVRASRHHHDPFIDGELDMMSAVVCLGELLATEEGAPAVDVALGDADRSCPEVVRRVMLELGLTEQDMAALRVRCHEVIETLV